MLRLVGYTLPGFTGFFITLSALPAWLAGRGVPASLAGLVTTVFLVCTVGVQTIVPWSVQRFGLAPVLGGGLVALGAPTPLLLLSDHLGPVLAISAVRGAGFGALTVLGSMVTARIVPARRRGEALGIYGLAVAVPNVVVVPAGVALVSAGQFTWVAIIGAAPLLALPVVRGLAGDAAHDTAHSVSGRAGRRAALRAALGPTVVLMAVTLTGGALVTFLPIVRPDGALATVALLAFGLTGAASRWAVGVAADRSGLRVLLPIGPVAALIGMLGVALGLLLTGAAAGAAILLGAALLGVGYGMVQNLTLLAAFLRAHHRQTATVSAVWNIGFDSGTAIGAAAVGALGAAVTMPTAFALTSALIAATLPLAVVSGRPQAVRDG